MFRSKLQKILIGLLVSSLLFVAALFLVPLPPEKLDPPQSYRFYDRNDRLLSLIISADGFFRMRVPVNDISPLFVKTLLLYEDRQFFKHYGFNVGSLLRASWQNVSNQRVVSGASTITMQLARMLQRRKRSYWAKAVEIFRAIQLEMKYSKAEILARYLAIAPYGGNIEGIEAASYFYFGTTARHLSIGQIALLVSIPKSPNQYRPDKQPLKAKAQRNKILAMMVRHKLINKDQYSRALAETVSAKRKHVRNLIPHVAWRHRFRHKKQYKIKTTIDENIQRRATTLLVNYVKRLKNHNITNGSIIVIDNKSREVRAWVGSTNYLAKKSLGSNDGAYAPRSPGSTIKPFVYGLALQHGLISQHTKLYDVPMSYSGYSPINFDHSYRGLVSVQSALTESLNVVAVELLRRLGVSKLHHLLKTGGISTLVKPPEYYGLPLVLGGVEVRLIDLTNLYSSLANQGRYKPYRLFEQDNTSNKKEVKSKVLLSPSANWLLTHMMTDVTRPDFPASWRYTKNRPTVAWKTGTSYNQRDAWSIGFTSRYTVGIWLGNFNGTPSRELIGSHSAGPLLFDVIQAIDPVTTQVWFKKPDSVKERKVCALSGKLPTRFCKHLQTEYYLSLNTKSEPKKAEFCSIHQSINKKIHEIWPPRLARHLHQQGYPVTNVPPYKIEKVSSEKYYKPVILSPSRGAVYIRRSDQLSNRSHGIKLSVAVTNRVKKIYWFLDKQLISSGDPYKDLIINPKPGKYKITVMDDVGGIDTIKLNIVMTASRVEK